MTATISTSTVQTVQVIAALNRQQANTLVTYLNYKKYHWLSFGALFRDIHLLFDDHATQVLAMLDELAERSLMLDSKPIADPTDYFSTATVLPSVGKQTLRQMIEAAVSTHEQIITEMHQDAEEASHIGDIGTADLYTRLVQVHQKQRWFLKEFLEKGDGLIS